MSLKAFFVKFNLRAVESSHGLYHGVKAERHMVQLFINYFVKFLHRQEAHFDRRKSYQMGNVLSNY